jgi:hypothetical protein
VNKLERNIEESTMRRYWTFLHVILPATLLSATAFAQPPEAGGTVNQGTPGIYCLKDVLATAYAGVTKASQVKPKLDDLFDKNICKITALPVPMTVSAVTKLGTVETDLSDNVELQDVYVLTLDYQDVHFWVLWAEKSSETPI